MQREEGSSPEDFASKLQYVEPFSGGASNPIGILTEATKKMTSDNADEVKRQLQELEAIVTSLLGNANHSEEALRSTVEKKYRAITASLASDADCEELTRRLIARLSIDVERGVAVYAEDYKPWLADRRRDIVWSRWLTYKQYLINAKWPPPRVVEKLDELTDQILDFAGNPNIEGGWARRGLVLGDVQSGKTASYLALFNKAADAGYRLIIVLAGHTEYLRQQTQRRVDEGFIGRDTSRNANRAGTTTTQRLIGVGGINKQIANPQGMTTAARDFTKSSREATSITIDSKSFGALRFFCSQEKQERAVGSVSVARRAAEDRWSTGCTTSAARRRV